MKSELLLNTFCAKYPSQRLSSYDCNHTFNADSYILTSASATKRPYVEKVLHEYWQHLEDNHEIDFELILYYSYLLLRDNDFISKILSNIFSHVLVDEFQDTKELQYLILSKIISRNKKNIQVFIVGDPNQSIYGTLGGYAIEKTDLEKITGVSFLPYELSENYRSSIKLIEYFDYFKTFPNKIVGSGKNKDHDSIISFNNTIVRDDLEDEIVRLINHSINELKISPNEICVLAPQWAQLAGLTRNLMVKMPDYSFNGPGMAPFSRDIENFFYKVCRIILTEPSPSLYLSRLRWAREIIAELNNKGFNTSDLSPKELLKICNSIQIEEPEGLKYLERVFDEIAAKLNLKFNDYQSLVDDYNSFFESSTQRIERLTKEGNPAISSTETFRKVFKQKDGITISTMHGVKGLEYDTVIAFGILQDWVPHFSDPDGANSAKKLLYVIASRARLNLHLISERNRFKRTTPPQELICTYELRNYDFKYTII